MGWIVDRIVNLNAPAATLAQQASIEMLEARRAERNYFLLHDPSYLEPQRAERNYRLLQVPSYLEANRDSLERTKEILGQIQELEPQEAGETQKSLSLLEVYEQRFDAAVTAMEKPRPGNGDRIRSVVRAYEKDLDDLLRAAKRKRRAQLVEELRSRVGSFDAQISKTIQEGNPALAQVTADMQSSSEEVLALLSEIEAENWKRVESDHQEARRMIHQAKWTLSLVSAFTLLFSVWVSFMLPSQVVKPLIKLREAVDQAARGNTAIKFEIEARGEVADLTRSVDNLIVQLRHST